MRTRLPKVGMRNVKTAVAVGICFLIFLPFWSSGGGEAAMVGPFYACIAAIICMQGSVEQSVRQGVSRLIGTAIGGAAGLLVLLVDDLLEIPLLTGVLLAGGVILVIWLCNAIHRPAASSIGAIVLCVFLINHSGDDRYLYALVRRGETAVGILGAGAVNRLLPDHREEVKNTPTAGAEGQGKNCSAPNKTTKERS